MVHVNNKAASTHFEVDAVSSPVKLAVPGTDNHVDRFTQAHPIDFTFRNLVNFNHIHNILPRKKRCGLPKSVNEKYITRTVWLNNNSLTKMDGIASVVDSLLLVPQNLAWLDFSFNQIKDISDELINFVNLKILYLHSNHIFLLSNVIKLRGLTQLRELTLHGNPIEKTPNYRLIIVNTLKHIIKLDFVLITEDERTEIPLCVKTRVPA